MACGFLFMSKEHNKCDKGMTMNNTDKHFAETSHTEQHLLKFVACISQLS